MEEHESRPEIIAVAGVAAITGLVWLCIGIWCGWLFWGD